MRPRTPTSTATAGLLAAVAYLLAAVAGVLAAVSVLLLPDLDAASWVFSSSPHPVDVWRAVGPEIGVR